MTKMRYPFMLNTFFIGDKRRGGL